MVLERTNSVETRLPLEFTYDGVRVTPIVPEEVFTSEIWGMPTLAHASMNFVPN
jgi:hypothetical protein